ncbi:MAG TPA: Hpt domain-containing protein [Dongiaceae bacterium]|nr:Hpt domain-containing protein [Dongiaceae bacterium]
MVVLVQVGGSGYDDMTKQLDIEYHDDASERVAEMAQCLAQIGQDGPTDALLGNIRRQGHNLKGTAASFGYPVVTMIAHRLETYLNDMRQWTPKALEDLYRFVDRMGEMLDRPHQPSDDEIAQIVRGLPAQSLDMAAPAGTGNLDIQIKVVEIMLVTPTRTIAKLLSQQIIACGFRVNSVADPIEGLTMAIRTRPDMIITSQAMKGMTGVDLICALRAIGVTERIPACILTSQEAGAAVFDRLPAGTMLMRTGEQFADDFGAAIAQYGLG